MKRFLRATTLATLTAVSMPLGAQPAADEQRAVALFDDGTRLYRKSKWADAEAKFQASWDLVRAPDTAANLGDCELYIGQTREAAEHLAHALRTLPVSTEDALRKRLRIRLEEAKRAITTLAIVVNKDGASVAVDGKPIGISPLSEVFVDPGSRRLVVELAGYKRHEQSIDAARGTSIDVSVALEAESKTVDRPPTPSATTTAPPPPPPPDHRSLTPAIALGAVGAIGVIGGFVFIGMAGSRGSRAEDIASELRNADATCEPPTPGFADRCTEFNGAASDHNTFEKVGVVGVSVGAAALTIGAAYLLWPKSSPARTTGVSVRAGPRGVVVRGAF